MKFAIVIISTNKYKKFLKPLIDSLDKYFNPSGGKKYFLFTDEKLDWFDNHSLIDWTGIEDNTNKYLIIVKKFHYINEYFNKLKQYDYILYIDSDMELVNTITEDMFDLKDKKYFSVNHSSNLVNPNFWTVEKNPLSTAYLGERNDSIYIHACVFGAKSSHMEYMANTIKNNVNTDLKNGIIAIWTDESHLNRFFVDHKNDVMILDSGFACPEEWKNSNKILNKFIIHKKKDF